MAAGLGFKDFVTGEVLTAADVDGYLMQGIWVFASAAARDAAVTSPQEGNACYLKDTNEVLTYSGSAWVAVGGAGGGMTLINTGGTTLSGASITISSIPSGYNYLTLFVENYKPATDTSQLTMRFNADSSASYKQEAGNGANMAINNNEIYLTGEVDNGTAQGFVVSDIYNYLSTTGWRLTRNNSWANNPTTTANGNWQTTTGVYTATGSAITSLLLKPISGNFTSGTAYLYGVK